MARPRPVGAGDAYYSLTSAVDSISTAMLEGDCPRAADGVVRGGFAAGRLAGRLPGGYDELMKTDAGRNFKAMTSRFRTACVRPQPDRSFLDGARTRSRRRS